MAQQEHQIRVEELAVIFHDAESLEDAINELGSVGFDRADISILADEKTIEKKLGHLYSRVEELEDDLDVPRMAFVSTEAIGGAEGALIGSLLYVGAVAAAGAIVISGGTLATAIAGVVVAGGASAALGGVLANWIDEHHAQYIHKQIDKGGLLLWVRTRDDNYVRRAIEVLKRHSPSERHIHFHKSVVD